MTTFVLVHGAWHGGWCYARTAKLLRAQGHDVFTPTMTGLGERSHMSGSGINLSMHVLDICNVLKWEGLTDVVLCGHSYGGMVITGVAEAMPERIGSLVYLDAFVPENGKALWDYVDDNFRGFFMQTAGESGGLTAPVPAAGFNVNAKDQAWVDAMCVPMALACFMEKAKITARSAAVKKRSYIVAAGWAPSPFTQFHDALKTNPAWTTHVSKAGHDVMVDDPEGLAGMLLASA
jgi:pimeloyl-ACP methyl ester carboxylesterase